MVAQVYYFFCIELKLSFMSHFRYLSRYIYQNLYPRRLLPNSFVYDMTMLRSVLKGDQKALCVSHRGGLLEKCNALRIEFKMSHVRRGEYFVPLR